MGLGAKAVCIDHNATVVAGMGESQSSPTVTIGTQTWMSKNLDVTHYNDGTPIDSPEEWTTGTAAAEANYTVYDLNPINNVVHGKLYTGYAVQSGKLAPDGFHIPTHDEAIVLSNYLGQSGYSFSGTAGSKLAGSAYLWTYSDTIKNEPGFGDSGWNGTPDGYGYAGYSSPVTDHPEFGAMGLDGYWWTSTQAWQEIYWAFALMASYTPVYHFDVVSWAGMSVRCIKD